MIDLIATILSILGAIVNAKHNIYGFHIWIVSNIIWIVYSAMTNQLWLMITFFVYSFISLYGIYHWKNGDSIIKKK